jgi:hypothetical protein
MENKFQGTLNSAYNTPEKNFKSECIFDYIYFIRTFFSYSNNEKDIKEDLYKYFNNGNISVFNLNNSNSNRKIKNNLEKLYKSNGNKLLQSHNERNLFAGGAPKPLGLSVITRNDNENSTPRSNSRNNNVLNTPRSNSRNNVLLNTSFLSLQNTPPRPAVNLFNQQNLNLPNQNSKNVFKTNDFKIIFTAGKQSNMMVSSDNEFYFKKYSSKQPAQTKKHLENECRVYAYLRDTNLEFLKNCTCFVNCFKNGILLRNGGSSLEEMLKQKNFIFNKKYFDQFFSKLYLLHRLLVTFNDLHIGNVVGYSDIRFIDLGLAKIHPPEVFDDNFLQMIHVAFSGLFFALCAKYNIN